MRLRALLALSLLACSACDATIAGMPPKTLTYTEDARKAYAEAMSAFQTKDWEAAKALFADLKKKFSQTREARLADLRLADIEFATERYTDAISAYRTFVTTFRNDREVEYARYKLAKALFFDISDTFLQPPAEERDQATTMDAHRELRAFMKAFRNSRYQKDVEYMLEVVTGRLVRHELYLARYYRRLENYDATLARIDYALKNFPNSGLDPEAIVLRGETLMMMNRKQEAKLEFEKVVRDWGGPFAVDAKEFLAELGTPSQEPSQIRRPPDPGPAKPTAPGDPLKPTPPREPPPTPPTRPPGEPAKATP
jgi:outer membrane protein assembly factor BamD